MVLSPLLVRGAVERAGRGRPKRQTHCLMVDMGYSSRTMRQYACRRGVRHTTLLKVNEHRTGPFDRTIHRQSATRYENRAADYDAT
jgi:hypothetical protein